VIVVLSHEFLYARSFCRRWRYFVDCCMVSCFFVCPFFNTITTAGKIAFPHCQEKCPHEVIPPSSQRAVPRIVLTPRPVIHRAVEHLRQRYPHVPSSTLLAVPRVVVATAAHAVKATFGAIAITAAAVINAAFLAAAVAAIVAAVATASHRLRRNCFFRCLF
jgi:hypothetical protein